MNFNYPCFVRVDDSHKRAELIKWLEEIGYYYVVPPDEEKLGDKVICESSFVGVAHDEQIFASVNYIDTGSDISLFRAIAAMNDNNDKEQWFIAKRDISDFFDIDDIVYHKGDMFFNESSERVNKQDARKADVCEIISYFNSKK